MACMESVPMGDAMGGSQDTSSKHFISSSSAASSCLISLTSPAKALSWTSMFKSGKSKDEETGEREQVAFYLGPNNDAD